MIAENLARIRAKIAEAAARCGRRPEEVTLVAVSKSHGPEAVREAFEAGQILFGENRVQEGRAKAEVLPNTIRWHLIGHLQSNKVRQALGTFERIQGVDTVKLARDINRIGGELGLFPKILLEVNVAGEGSKFGFEPEALRVSMEEILRLERVTVEGLMTIPPYSETPEDSRRHFATLRELRDRLAKEFNVPLPELSMGMSGDFSLAIEEGATIVRVGTALFGER